MSESRSTRTYPPISDYGMIGDCRSAALVSKSGSIDWLCWPRFDSPSIFARILDWERGGLFEIVPDEPFESSHRYLPGTNVLETSFTTERGEAVLTDLMPALSHEHKRQHLTPFRSIVRRLTGTRGRVKMKMRCAPRLDYGRRVLTLRNRGARTACYTSNRHSLFLRSTIEFDADEKMASRDFVIHSGCEVDYGLAWSDLSPAVLPPLGEAASRQIEETVRYWRDWAGKVTYEGPWRELVLRSALTLKLLCFAPSGAIIAAPTTSLPEWIGGERNWDYRYCWLRDASYTTQALYDLGCDAEADSYMRWLLHATRLTHPELNVMYDVHGDPKLDETQRSDLEGYRGSRPVRVGNDAHDQVQLDVYGEVMTSLVKHHEAGKIIDRSERKFARGLADRIADRWRVPDDGIWEQRGGARQHVHAKVICWELLAGAVYLSDEGVLHGDVAKWRAAANDIRDWVHDHGWSDERRSFVATAGGEHLDASALTFSKAGFIAGDDPRMNDTIDAIRAELGVEELVYRYRGVDDGLPGDEGAFLACSFWLVSALAAAGRIEEAESTFEALARHASALGLYSEEIDPATGSFLGNFPQGLTHIGLINAALDIEKSRRGQSVVPKMLRTVMERVS